VPISWTALARRSPRVGCRPPCLVLAALLAACALAPASAQQATERYVPIGRSPGVSGVSTVTGTVESVDAAAGRLTLRTDTGPRVLEIADATRIWLDRSALGESNRAASLGACQPGREVEVKLAAGGRRADWIKIRAPGP
jgi:hypothetical protein